MKIVQVWSRLALNFKQNFKTGFKTVQSKLLKIPYQIDHDHELKECFSAIAGHLKVLL